jgi:hypothetical protein
VLCEGQALVSPGVHHMTLWLIIVPTVCYALAACMYGWQKNWPMVVVYSGYAFANCGLLWLDRLMAK